MQNIPGIEAMLISTYMYDIQAPALLIAHIKDNPVRRNFAVHPQHPIDLVQIHLYCLRKNEEGQQKIQQRQEEASDPREGHMGICGGTLPSFLRLCFLK